MYDVYAPMIQGVESPFPMKRQPKLSMKQLPLWEKTIRQ